MIHRRKNDLQTLLDRCDDLALDNVRLRNRLADLEDQVAAERTEVRALVADNSQLTRLVHELRDEREHVEADPVQTLDRPTEARS